MRISAIKTSPRFEKSYKKLSKLVKKKALEREKIFRNDCFDQRLNTHKLSGKDSDAWAFWVDYTYRIKFCFLESDGVIFLEIGTHDIYS